MIKETDGTVEGCHETRESAKRQVAALYASEKGEQMERKTVVATTEVTDTGAFSALAAAYTVDRGGDRIIAGAFRETIRRWQDSGKKIPLHWDHEGDAEKIIGVVDPQAMRETEKGLYVEGRLDLEESAVAREAWRLMRNDAAGVSFGYLATEEKQIEDEEVRELWGLDVFEITITPAPMNFDTRILSMKALADAKDFTPEDVEAEGDEEPQGQVATQDPLRRQLGRALLEATLPRASQEDDDEKESGRELIGVEDQISGARCVRDQDPRCRRVGRPGREPGREREDRRALQGDRGPEKAQGGPRRRDRGREPGSQGGEAKSEENKGCSWTERNRRVTIPPQRLSPGELFIRSDQYKNIRARIQESGAVPQFDTGAIALDLKGTLLEGTGSPGTGTGGGLLQVPDVVPGATETLFQRLTVRDLIASGTTNTNSIRYTIEGTATSGAAGVAEGAAKPESTLGLSTTDEPVKKVATSLTVSDELLEDNAQVSSTSTGA